MDEWFDYSQQRIVMCSKQLLKKLSSLTIKINIWPIIWKLVD